MLWGALCVSSSFWHASNRDIFKHRRPPVPRPSLLLRMLDLCSWRPRYCKGSQSQQLVVATYSRLAQMPIARNKDHKLGSYQCREEKTASCALQHDVLSAYASGISSADRLWTTSGRIDAGLLLFFLFLAFGISHRFVRLLLQPCSEGADQWTGRC